MTSVQSTTPKRSFFSNPGMLKTEPLFKKGDSFSPRTMEEVAAWRRADSERILQKMKGTRETPDFIEKVKKGYDGAWPDESIIEMEDMLAKPKRKF
jgi:hypothetical protein